MEKRVNVRFEMFRRVLQFGVAYTSRFLEASPAARAFAALSTIVDALNDDAGTSLANLREGRDQKTAAREALILRLDAIARMAQVIAQTSPGFDERFVLPRPKNHQRVLATAHAFVDHVAPVAAQFVAHGLPEDFVATLTAALENYERASAARDAGRLARASATAGARKALAEGRRLVRQLDVIVRYQFAGDDAMQGAWARARHLDGLPLRPSTTGTRPTAPTTPVTTTPTGPPSTVHEVVQTETSTASPPA